jgi:hypothetical protein
MNDRIVDPKHLRALYAFLVVIATVAATKAMIWPRWPMAQPLEQDVITEALTKGRFKISPLKPLAAKRDAELATSSALGYSLDNVLELRLMRGVARRRFNFQTAFLTKEHPELQLKQRHLSPGIPAYAIGFAQKQPSVQTCLVGGDEANKAFGVTREELPSLVDQMSKTKWSGPKSILGLQPNRDYQCIVIQAKTTDGSAISINRAKWLHLLSVLQSALQKESSKTSINVQN